MSANRSTYDTCSYKASLAQSVAPASYMLDPIKYNHCNKCFNSLGLVGGVAVSHVSGNLIDLENDLRGQNRPLTHCPSFQYAPPTNNILQGKEYIKPVQHPEIDITMKHLPSCQFFPYPEVPLPEPIKRFKCPA